MDTQGEGRVHTEAETWSEASPRQGMKGLAATARSWEAKTDSPPKPSGSAQARRYLNVRRPASKTVRKTISVVISPAVCRTL